MNSLWEKKIIRPVADLLRQGISHEKIAMSIAVGTVLGIFPILGATTMLCALAALILRLNLPAIQMVNFIVYPLQLFLLLPFLKVGGWLFGDQRFSQIGNEIIDLIRNDFWGSFGMLWDLTIYAVVLWLIISPMVMITLYKVLKPALKKLPLDKFSHAKSKVKTITKS
jgi:uncharacterized protein (DUF2062 family)